MATSLVTAPSAEPILAADAKLFLRVDSSTDDTLITLLIKAARERCEAATHRQLIQATWDDKSYAFPAGAWIDLPYPPLVSVSSVTYVNSDGVSTVWAASNYVVDAPAGPRCARGRIALAYDITAPTTRAQLNAVIIRFLAGYGTAGTSVPAPLLAAMYVDIGTLYENRQAVMAGSEAVVVSDYCSRIYRRFASYINPGRLGAVA